MHYILKFIFVTEYTQYNESTPPEAWLDTQFLPYNNENESETSMFFGPEFLSLKLYQRCSNEVIIVIFKNNNYLWINDKTILLPIGS